MTAREIIEAEGLVYLGEQQMPNGMPAAHVFNVHGEKDDLPFTLMITGEVTRETVAAKVAELNKLRQPNSGNAHPVAVDSLELYELRLADTIKTDLRHMLECSVYDKDLVITELRCRAESIKDFGELHDVLDANILGETDKVWSVMEDVGPPPADYLPGISREDAAVQYQCDVVNAAQDEVDRWIKLGGLRTP